MNKQVSWREDFILQIFLFLGYIVWLGTAWSMVNAEFPPASGDMYETIWRLLADAIPSFILTYAMIGRYEQTNDAFRWSALLFVFLFIFSFFTHKLIPAQTEEACLVYLFLTSLVLVLFRKFAEEQQPENKIL